MRGLLETVWKVSSRIINAWITGKVEFNDAFHGVGARRGCGIAIIEAKLVQQLSLRRQVPLYAIFLDLRKAYYTLDRERTLEILEVYGVSQRCLCLLLFFWDHQLVVARELDYHGRSFDVTSGVTQGDIISPTIFNVIADAAISYWLSIVLPGEKGVIACEGMGDTIQEKCCIVLCE